jgi:RecA/RadA recombinase
MGYANTDYLAELVYRCCTKDMYPHFQQNKMAYLWIHNHWLDGHSDNANIINKHTYTALLYYIKLQKKCPTSLSCLKDYIAANPDNIPDFGRAAGILDEIDGMSKEYEPLDTDDDIFFTILLTRTRERWFEMHALVACSIARGECNGTNKLMKDGEHDKSGVSAAITYLRQKFSDDYSLEAPAVAGLLHENIDVVRDNIAKMILDAKSTGKFPMGFPHIDERVIVGRQDLRYIGIVGMSGDGKTTLTNQIVYNWLMLGAHILYVSTEHSPAEIWQAMTWLHQTHPDYDFSLPPINDWNNGAVLRKVSSADFNNKERLLRDIQSRINLPGLLDVQQYQTWADVKDHLEVNREKYKYDILVVDYLTRLEVEGNPRFRDDAVNNMITEAQRLTRSYDNNKGLIILTPIQVNREANKRAKASDDPNDRYDLNAIGTYSKFQHDLDLCLSVYSSEEQREHNIMELSASKARTGKKPVATLLSLNPCSKSCDYLKDEPIKETWIGTMDEMATTYSTTETKDVSENWGL